MPITHFDSTGLTLYAQFDDVDDTKVPLNEGTGSKTSRYTVSDTTISAAGLNPTNTYYSATIRQGNYLAPLVTDTIRGTVGAFYWNGSIELPAQSDVYRWNGEVVQSLDTGMLPVTMIAVMGTLLSEVSAGNLAGNFSQLFDNNDAITTTILDDIGSGTFPLSGIALDNFNTFYINGSSASTKVLNDIPQGLPLTATGITNFSTFFNNGGNSSTVLVSNSGTIDLTINPDF